MRRKKWVEAYSHSLEALARAREKLKFIVGFNVNIDAVKHVTRRDVERIMRHVSLSEVVKKVFSPPMKVESLEDFLAGLLLCLKEGIGEEWIITSSAISKKLEEVLGWDETRMGGQGGNMSNVLASLGQIAITNVPSLPSNQAELFYDENVLVPILTGEGVTFRHPREAVRLSDPPLIHWISEFKKGFSVNLDGLSFEAPRDNRFIATFDDVNARLQLAPGFREGSVLEAEDAVAAVVSGYHLLREKYSGGETCWEVLEDVVSLIKEWRSVNPELSIHAEMGFTASCVVRKAILNSVFPNVSSVGVNETELQIFHSPDHAKPLSSYSAPELYLKAKSILDKYRLKRVFIHTREYSMSIVRQSYGVHPEEEFMALLFGASLAATLAATGMPPTISRAKEMMNKGFEISEDGLREHKKLASLLDTEGEADYKLFVEHGFVYGDPGVVFVPSILVREVKATVGLGDTICSGTLVGEHLLKNARKKAQGSSA
ncbi:MAG: ADP-dependent glucokinase/phosphofructokinase [Candidatus Jordarchaeales archaeon]|nr:hypothetical protein [Candidatus Jordarchaeia archaeon]